MSVSLVKTYAPSQSKAVARFLLTAACESAWNVYGAREADARVEAILNERDLTLNTNVPVFASDVMEADAQRMDWVESEVVIGGDCSHNVRDEFYRWNADTGWEAFGACLSCGETF